MADELYIGLMSGTSLDGIDAVLACFGRDEIVAASRFAPFPSDLRADLFSLLRPGADETHRAAIAGNRLALAYADAVRELLAQAGQPASAVRAIGCHGQTIRHDPAHGYTVQIGNGALLAESTGIPVVCDFRSRDIAAGGQGAPLVPAFHASVFGKAGVARAIVNVGGIANVTHLSPDGAVIGFDCGPGNALMDEWIAERQGLVFDADGGWAACGTPLEPLLTRLLADPFFSTRPPKSTGRELFNLKWAHPHIPRDAADADVQATLCELSARTIADSIERFCPSTAEVYVCGGGASNATLMRRLGAAMPASRIASTAELGLHPDWVEAAAFAWLARESLAGRPGNLPAVTGASGPRVLGCVYPA